MSITIKEIAKLAQVSTATVSMILNKKDQCIGDATREKVLAIAAEHHYIPNNAARSLVTRKTNTIGLIMPDITNPFFPEIARGAEDKASESRYSIIFCNTDDSERQEEKYIDILTEKMVDGIIFAHAAESEEGCSGLNKCKLPVILIDRDYNNENVKGRVVVDNEKGSYSGVSHLIKQGYRKILYIAGAIKTQTAKDRLAGYRRALSENLIDYKDYYVKSGSYRREWGYEAMGQFLNENIPFDSVFCGNDLIAFGAIKKLKEAGYRIPEDIGVVGFDDIYVSSMMEPALTTVKQPNYEMGYRAVELLIDVLEKKNLESNHKIVLDTELVVRNSTRLLK
ncbi:LacI family DNA-binding transcriptional regulator [Sinanaerobacter chloroacetimidivorans]|jgi:LacI family transcriptional regulator|uniref:LacI family DNA-binding transcriptional regulator n=1 Tax=Sinanaerobacter chloroacetimidivorans TaxID=2818044 RepID=A0A8J7W050_9FIRM|nr:LacI family DNA-binding transcriptional regulator [Sinanaerobacter chloroacetimidivorans]MBR0596555.1 LacI family DNA-binding transcriptional regulator [Sinanaerobacter chloroacetimidivorans]